MSGCGCACHVGAGYRTWCEHCAPRPGNQCLVCFDHGDSTTSGELATAHIGCIRDLEARIEQLEIRDKMRDDGERALPAEIEDRDARIVEASLRKSRAIARAALQREETT